MRWDNLLRPLMASFCQQYPKPQFLAHHPGLWYPRDRTNVRWGRNDASGMLSLALSPYPQSLSSQSNLCVILCFCLCSLGVVSEWDFHCDIPPGLPVPTCAELSHLLLPSRNSISVSPGSILPWSGAAGCAGCHRGTTVSESGPPPWLAMAPGRNPPISMWQITVSLCGSLKCWAWCCGHGRTVQSMTREAKVLALTLKFGSKMVLCDLWKCLPSLNLYFHSVLNICTVNPP
jgi:hypothetical protein